MISHYIRGPIFNYTIYYVPIHYMTLFGPKQFEKTIGENARQITGKDTILATQIVNINLPKHAHQCTLSPQVETNNRHDCSREKQTTNTMHT